MSVLLALIFVAAASSTAPPATFDDMDYAFAAERDVVIEGVRLRVLESGPADGPRVLLLHCFGLSSQVWREVMPGLAAAGFHVVAYDAPGHGKSDKPARALTLRHLGEVAVAVLDALNWPDADLIGNSMGGGTALTVALDHPGRARRLVLVDSVGLDLHAWYGPPWLALDARHAAGAPDWCWRLVFDLAVEKRSPLVERVSRELIATRADPLAARATANFKSVVDDLLRTDRLADLGRVKNRTLVVTGVHDRLVDPAISRRLADGVAGSVFVVYDDLGHLPEIEDGPRLADDIIAFLHLPEANHQMASTTTLPP